MADAGGGIFVLFLFSLSAILLAIWTSQGKGTPSWKLTFAGFYFLATILPTVLAYYIGDWGFYPVTMSNVAFVFGLLILTSGFIIPVLANRYQRANHT